MAHPVNGNLGIAVVAAAPGGQQQGGAAPIGIGAAPNGMAPAPMVVLAPVVAEPKKGIFVIAKEKWTALWKAISTICKNCLAICFPRPRNAQQAVAEVQQQAQEIGNLVPALEELAVANPGPGLAQLVVVIQRHTNTILNNINTLRDRVNPPAPQAVEAVRAGGEEILANAPILAAQPAAPGAIALALAHIRHGVQTVLAQVPILRGNPPAAPQPTVQPDNNAGAV